MSFKASLHEGDLEDDPRIDIIENNSFACHHENASDLRRSSQKGPNDHEDEALMSHWHKTYFYQARCSLYPAPWHLQIT